MIIIVSETVAEDYQVEEVFEYGTRSLSWYLTSGSVHPIEMRYIKQDIKTW
jgi:hypothetical protein